MFNLSNLLKRPDAAPAAGAAAPPERWSRLFASRLGPRLTRADGSVLVWGIEDDASKATISEQFKSQAGTYHARYAASEHFEILFRQGLEGTGARIPPAPVILDLGSGSGVNSVVPCLRLFDGCQIVATDLSAELLAILAEAMEETQQSDQVLCVTMDAMGEDVAEGRFDLVTGASILHHLERPQQGLKAASRALKPGGHAIFFEPFQGWTLMRLAYDRILAEAEIRGGLDPVIVSALQRQAQDIAARTNPDPDAPDFACLDDKWLFASATISAWAEQVGLRVVGIHPHNAHKTLYRDAAGVQLRLTTGRTDLEFPPWAIAILDNFDAAISKSSKQALMLEGTIVLRKD